MSLSLSKIDKSFNGKFVVSSASIDIREGILHAVVGENGAGKSTLLKIAAGVLSKDAGTVLLDGRPLTPHTAEEAMARGVGMVQQHFALIDTLSAIENVVLGVEPTLLARRGRLFGALDFQTPIVRQKLSEIGTELGLTFSWNTKVGLLGVGDKQRLEIARVLYRNARILILDEPTAVLTHDESSQLYDLLRRLVEAKRAVVVVTHKLEEVREYADEVTVLRKGKVVSTRFLPPSTARVERANAIREVTSEIMGDSALPAPEERTGILGDPVLRFNHVSFGGAIFDLGLTLHAGEIVGIAGIEGNGQKELVLLASGIESAAFGEIIPGDAERRKAVSAVFEDRRREGLVLSASIMENAMLGDFARFSSWRGLDLTNMRREAGDRVSKFGVNAPLDEKVSTLSGGNQQRVVMARALLRGKTRVLVLAHPTRGVDIAASRFIHDRILGAAEQGVAVLVMSSDLNELRLLADRILVMRSGSIVSEFPRTATDAELGKAMLGVRPAAKPDVSRGHDAN